MPDRDGPARRRALARTALALALAAVVALLACGTALADGWPHVPTGGASYSQP